MCKENKREHPLLHSVRVVHPLGEHALLHLLDQLGLLHVVRHRVGGHVKQQEVLLLCRQHTLFHLRFKLNTGEKLEKYYQVLGKSLPHVLELVPQLKWVPSLTR